MKLMISALLVAGMAIGIVNAQTYTMTNNSSIDYRVELVVFAGNPTPCVFSPPNPPSTHTYTVASSGGTATHTLASDEWVYKIEFYDLGCSPEQHAGAVDICKGTGGSLSACSGSATATADPRNNCDIN